MVPFNQQESQSSIQVHAHRGRHCRHPKNCTGGPTYHNQKEILLKICHLLQNLLNVTNSKLCSALWLSKSCFLHRVRPGGEAAPGSPHPPTPRDRRSKRGGEAPGHRSPHRLCGVALQKLLVEGALAVKTQTPLRPESTEAPRGPVGA